VNNLDFMLLVVFVHGFRWQANISPSSSPSCEDTFENLSEYLQPYLEREWGSYRFEYYEYPTGLFRQRDNIPQEMKPTKETLNFNYSAREFKNKVSEYIVDERINDLRIALIGHSAGGIVIRYALVIDDNEIELDNDIITSLKNIILIASPSEGSPVIRHWLISFFEEILTTQFKQLGFKSLFITELNRRWGNFVIENLEHTNICHLYAQSDPFAPPPTSDSIDEQPIIIIENTDHNGILRDCRTHQHIQNLLAT
jgi:hypothetical protein